MKIPILVLTVVGYSLAVPEGYYHQEYNYKTSQSSFKNNELVHKSDDQGYYKKDGDVDNRFKPVEDANSEHSEYVNPKYQNSQNSQYGYDSNSYGNMRADGTRASAFGTANNYDIDGLARNDRIYGSQSGVSSGYGSNNFETSSGYSNYGISSSLRTITMQLQQEMERELQEAVRRNNLYSQTRIDLGVLEQELRRNLTERINNELSGRYGQQTIRSGMSYSINGGRLQPTANYDNRELTYLKNQIENALLSQLRTQYSYGSSSSNQYNHGGIYTYSTTQRPVQYTSYRPIYPVLPTQRYTDISYNNYGSSSTKARYTPIPNPESLTAIASKVQSQLDLNLNTVLDDTRRTHFSSSQQYALTNPDALLERLRNELKSNITYQLDEIIRNNYGNQMQRDGYLYSVGSNGAVSTDSNYALRDLESLREQIERNLLNKLSTDFNTYRSSWSSSSSYNSQSNYGSNTNPAYYEPGISTGNAGYNSRNTGYNTDNAGYHSGTAGYSSGGSGYSTGSKGYSSGSAGYNSGSAGYNSGSAGYNAGSAGYNSGSTGYSSGGTGYSSGSDGYNAGSTSYQHANNMAELQRRLQEDLSKQLNFALNKESQSYSSNPQNYQSSLQELSDQLNRNLTRNLQEYSASGSYSASGNFDSTQMAQLKSRLEQSLMNQLRQGLQESFRTHSSYNAGGSSSSNYQVGTYNSGYGGQGSCCQGDDPNVYYRVKRSYVNSQNRQLHDGHQIGHQKLNLVRIQSKPIYQQEEENLGQQEIDDSDVDQNVGIPRHNINRNTFQSNLLAQQDLSQKQELEDQDLGQQIEESEYPKSKLGKLLSQTLDQIPTNHFDIIQQQINRQKLNRGKIQSKPIYHQKQEDLGQQEIDEFDNGQNVDFPRHNFNHNTFQSKLSVQQDLSQKQEFDDLDLEQQIEESQYPKSKLGKIQSQTLDQQVENHFNLERQQVGYHNLDRGRIQSKPIHHQEQEDLGQQEIDDSDVDQNVGFPRHNINHNTFQSKLSVQQDLSQKQELDDLDLGQQIEESRYPKSKLRKIQSQTLDQQLDNPFDLEQQQISYHNLNRGRIQSKPIHHQEQEDLGQQEIDESDLGQNVDFPRHNINHNNFQSTLLGQQEDLGQKQELDDLDLGQQIEESQYPKSKLGKIQSQTLDQQLDNHLDLEQQEIGYHNLNRGRIQSKPIHHQEQEDLGQQEIDESDLGQNVNFPRHNINHNNFQSKLLGQQEDLGQKQELDDLDLGQQIEESQYPKSKLRKIQSQTLDQQLDNPFDLEQQQIGYHKLNRGRIQSKPIHHQEQEDVGQQEIDQSDIGQNVDLPRHNINHNTFQSKLLDQHDLGQKQELDDLYLGQQTEETEYPKSNRGKILSQTLDQQPENHFDIEQQQIGYQKLNQGRIQSKPIYHQEQENLGQQEIDDSGQKQEQDYLDLGQRTEESEYPNINRGKLTLNHERNVDQQQEELSNPSFRQQEEIIDGKLQFQTVGQNQEDFSQQEADMHDSNIGYNLQGYQKVNRGKLQLKPLVQSQLQGYDQEEDQVLSKFNGGKIQKVPVIRQGEHDQQPEVDSQQIEEQDISWGKRPGIQQTQIQDIDEQKSDPRYHLREEIDITGKQGPNGLPLDIFKKTEFIQEKLLKKLENAIKDIYKTNTLNVKEMRRTLNEEIKKNATREFSKGHTRYHLQDELGLSEKQIIKLQTVTIQKLIAKLDLTLKNEPDSGTATIIEIEDTQQPNKITQMTLHQTITTQSQTSGGHKFDITDQGKFNVYPQSRAEAEREADLLISTLKNYVKPQQKDINEEHPTQGTFISSGTDNNGGQYHSITTIHKSSSQNVNPGYTSSHIKPTFHHHTVELNEDSRPLLKPSTGFRFGESGLLSSNLHSSLDHHSQEVLGSSVLLNKYNSPQHEELHHHTVELNEDSPPLLKPSTGFGFGESGLLSSNLHSSLDHHNQEVLGSSVLLNQYNSPQHEEHHHHTGELNGDSQPLLKPSTGFGFGESGLLSSNLHSSLDHHSQEVLGSSILLNQFNSHEHGPLSSHTLPLGIHSSFDQHEQEISSNISPQRQQHSSFHDQVEEEPYNRYNNKNLKTIPAFITQEVQNENNYDESPTINMEHVNSEEFNRLPDSQQQSISIQAKTIPQIPNNTIHIDFIQPIEVDGDTHQARNEEPYITIDEPHTSNEPHHTDEPLINVSHQTIHQQNISIDESHTPINEPDTTKSDISIETPLQTNYDDPNLVIGEEHAGIDEPHLATDGSHSPQTDVETQSWFNKAINKVKHGAQVVKQKAKDLKSYVIG